MVFFLTQKSFRIGCFAAELTEFSVDVAYVNESVAVNVQVLEQVIVDTEGSTFAVGDQHIEDFKVQVGNKISIPDYMNLHNLPVRTVLLTEHWLVHNFVLAWQRVPPLC